MATPVSINPRRCADAVQALLLANLPAQFNALDSNYNDSITIRDIVRFHKVRMGAYPDYPCCIIFPEGQSLLSDQGNGFHMRLHPIRIVFYECTNEALSGYLPVELMQIRLERTLEAAQVVLDAGRSLTVTGAVGTFINTITAPMFADFEPVPNSEILLRRSGVMDIEVGIKAG